MTVYVAIAIPDLADAHAAVKTVLPVMSANDGPMKPVHTGEQATLLFESMYFATPLSTPQVQQLAERTAVVVQQQHHVTLIQNQRSVPLTGSATQNQTVIAAHAASNADIVIEVS